jgi:hypothetical protein
MDGFFYFVLQLDLYVSDSIVGLKTILDLLHFYVFRTL